MIWFKRTPKEEKPVVFKKVTFYMKNGASISTEVADWEKLLNSTFTRRFLINLENGPHFKKIVMNGDDVSYIAIEEINTEK